MREAARIMGEQGTSRRLRHSQPVRESLKPTRADMRLATGERPCVHEALTSEESVARSAVLSFQGDVADELA